MFIYWIHLPEHIDIATDGYIGVSKNFNQRMFAHKKWSAYDVRVVM